MVWSSQLVRLLFTMLVQSSSEQSLKDSKIYIKSRPADKACLTLKMCNNPKCHLNEPFISEENVEKVSVEKHPPWQWIIDLFTKRFGDQHLPVFDYDNDSFSDVGTLRGYDWKGVDCD